MRRSIRRECTARGAAKGQHPGGNLGTANQTDRLQIAGAEEGSDDGEEQPLVAGGPGAWAEPPVATYVEERSLCAFGFWPGLRRCGAALAILALGFACGLVVNPDSSGEGGRAASPASSPVTSPGAALAAPAARSAGAGARRA
ncbi:unnamed protein product, partial [Prorocentrum cordatum]